MSVEVKNKVHGLRDGLNKVELNGFVGTVLVGWWVMPLKFVGEPGMF